MPFPLSNERTIGMVLNSVLFAPDLLITRPLHDYEVLAAKLEDGSFYYLRCSPLSYINGWQQKFWLDWDIAHQCQRITPDHDTILSQLQATPPDWEKFTRMGVLLPVGVPIRRGMQLTVKVCRRGSEPLEISNAPLTMVTIVNRRQVLERVEPSSAVRR
jgi:hypothetical protein